MFGYANKGDKESVKKAWIISKADIKEGLSKLSLRVLLHGIHNLWCPTWMAKLPSESSTD